jgi:hypothetical protein
VITWMLVAVHLRERHPVEHARLGGFLFAPRAFGWYLVARYRAQRDRGLNALGIPGSLGAWAIVLGAAAAIVAKLLSLNGAGA